MAVLVDVDLSTVDALDFAPACQGATHSAANEGHVPEQEASYLVSCPNCGPRVLVCAGRVAYLRREIQFVTCNQCGRITPTQWWKFTSLDGPA